MKKEITFTLDEVLKIFNLMENANELFHQQMSYRDTEIVEKFAKENYPMISELYYKTLWDKLPEEIQEKIMER